MRELGWYEAIRESGLFGPIEERHACFAQELDADTLVGRVLSISFVVSLPREQQAVLEHQLRTLAEARGGVVEFRYLTEAFVTFSVA